MTITHLGDLLSGQDKLKSQGIETGMSKTKTMTRAGRIVWTFAVLCVASVAWAQLPYNTADVIPADPTSLGYTVDNHTLRVKVHPVLPQRVALRNGGMIDARYRLANLTADDQGDYALDPEKKVVAVDTLTGEIKPTPYVGTIKCFGDGNLAIYIDSWRDKKLTFMYGKYGEPLHVWEGTLQPPKDKYLNPVSCTLEPRTELIRKDGTPFAGSALHHLRPEHGKLWVVPGAERPSIDSNASSEVKALMQKPFMQGMSLASQFEQWYFIKPNGNEVWIPNNPGEATLGVTYIPYLQAYFMAPGLRPLANAEFLSVPLFARLVYPDGHVQRFDVPDVIQQPHQKGELGFGGTMYTKMGLIWRITFRRFGTVGRVAYRGELEEGYYLQKKDKKVLVKLPDLSMGTSPSDGCTLELKPEVAQIKPIYLSNHYTINICTGE